VNVLHVIGTLAPRYGGPSTAVVEMAKALIGRGHRVEIFTTNLDGPARLPIPVEDRINWCGVPTTFFQINRPRSYATSLGLSAALSGVIDDYDIVHVHNLYLFSSLMAGHYCRRSHIPYIVSPHGTLDPYQRKQHRARKAVYDALIERRHLNAAAGLLYTSTAERDFGDSLRLKARSFVAPLGVDTATLTTTTPPDALFSLEPRLVGRALVTFIGRLTPKKQLELLVEAFAALKDTKPDAHLVIAGPDDEGIGNRLRARIRKLGLSDRVSLLGLVTGPAKTALLQQSHLFVLPSYDENFAVAVVEAMAAGLPVVVTRGVALHREIESAGAGLVVPATISATAAAMHRLLSDPAMSSSMGRSGQALATSTFAWDQIAMDLERMYQQAIFERPLAAQQSPARSGTGPR
jgi:glycosyltransferase involved in cell wall biosynthesis